MDNDSKGVSLPEKELEIEEPQTLEDGKHIGTVTKVFFKEVPYKYIDLYVKPDSADIELKVGYPEKITPSTALGKLFARFGIDVTKPGNKVNPTTTFLNRRVEFVTLSESGKNKENQPVTYATIIPDSVKPAKEFPVEKPGAALPQA